MQTNDNKLLLVDDDEVYCSILARALTRRGLKVSIAYSRQDALERAAETVPNLAVVDLRIGADSGLELIPALLGVNPALRIIVVDRVCKHRYRGGGHQARRRSVPDQARRRG